MTRVWYFGQDGQTFALELLRGGVMELVEQLDKAAFPGLSGSKSEEQLIRFRDPYLNRRKRVWTELKNVPSTTRDFETRLSAFERDLRYLEQLGR